MRRPPKTWFNSPDAVLHLQRQDRQPGLLAEQIVEAAIRSSSVRKRARAQFEAQLRDVDWRLPPDADIAVYAGTIAYHHETLYDKIELERRDLDDFAAAFVARQCPNLILER